MTRFHVRRRLDRLRCAPWRRLVAVTRQGFVFHVAGGSLKGFYALSWSGFYACRDSLFAESAVRGLVRNREVIRSLRARRGRRL